MIFGIIFTVIWFAFFAAMIAGFVIWILMLIDVIKRDFPKEDDKTLWILIVVLCGMIGAIIYYFIVKRKEDKKHVNQKKAHK